LGAPNSRVEADFCAPSSQSLKTDFHEVFCLRARDQHGPGDLEFQPPEFLLAVDVLRWFAGTTASDERKICLGRLWLKQCFRMGIKPGAVAPEGVQQ